MIAQANSMAMFQMMQMGVARPPMMGMPGAGFGFSFGMDSFGGSSFGMSMGMGGGIPFGGFGMNFGMGMGQGMGFGGFPPMGGFGMGGGMGMGGFPMMGMGMNPMMMMMLLMMMMQMMQQQQGGGGMPGGGFPGMGGQMAPGQYGNVKVSEGNPEKWYFGHGAHQQKDWTDPQTGKKLGFIDEGGDTRIYYHSESQTGYIYKKVEAQAQAHGAGCGCHTCVNVSGWQLTEIRQKWGGKSASPIMLDLDGSGTPDVKNGEWKPHANQGDIGANKVQFDLDGDGKKELTEWTGGKDGLLLKLSPEQIKQYNETGKLEVSGKELYGDQGGKYADGYEKMRTLSDANKDGKLSGNELQNHYTWQDANKDGKVDQGELASVQSKGITEINATHGGDYQSSFKINGEERKTWDWWPTTWNN